MRIHKAGRGPLLALLALAAVILIPGTALAGDASGAATLAEDPAIAIDFVWVLVSAAMVFLMQAGFAMVEGGFVRPKNTVNIMMKNVMDFCMGILAYFAVGFAIMFGDDVAGLLGTSGWLLLGDSYDVNSYLLFIFQAVFAATAATIVSGAIAERLKFSAYLVYSLALTAFIYPIYGHWVWGGGWLADLGFGMGHLDFAGSGVVHAVGGFVGLAGAMVLGPRFGKFDEDGTPRAIPGHNIPLATLGLFILWFGWFGFNGGSTLSAHELRMSVVIANTSLAAAAGALSALMIILNRTGKFDIGMTINGALGGLVAITAPCAWVEGWAAIVIGLIAGVVVVVGALSLENAGIDDPVGAVPVHGFNGIWGLLALGLFADGTYGNYTTEGPLATGLLYGGGADQLIAQAIGAAAVILWAFVLGYILFKVMDAVMGIRVSPEEELAGLDIQEHGSPAYPNFVTIEETTSI